MTQEWVTLQNKKRDEMLEQLYNETRQQLQNIPHAQHFVDDFITKIKESTRMGFTSSIYMIPEVMRDYFNSISNGSIQMMSSFRKELLSALDELPINQIAQWENEYFESLMDSEPRAFDGDIVITDPCYIIDWEEWDSAEDYDAFLSQVGLQNVIMRSTIYGDWSCTTFNTDTQEPMGQFCADAGLVGVFLLDEVLKYKPNFNYHIERPWTTTVIKDFYGSIQFIITEHQWTIDRDTPFMKAGDICRSYSVSVVGHGINKKTGEVINFHTKQTGL